MDQTSNSSQIPFNFNPNLNFNNPFNNIDNSTYNQNPMMMQNQINPMQNQMNQMMMQNQMNQMVMMMMQMEKNNNNHKQLNYYYYEDIYDYIREDKKKIKFIRVLDNEVFKVKVPCSLRKNELYYTAKKYKMFEFSEMQLFYKGNFMNEDETTIDCINDDDEIKIIEEMHGIDFSYYDLYLSKHENEPKINVKFKYTNGNIKNFIFTLNTSIKEMCKILFYEMKIPENKRKLFLLTWNGIQIYFYDESSLAKKGITNESIICVQKYRSFYIKLDVGKTITAFVIHNNEEIMKENVGTLTQIKKLYNFIMTNRSIKILKIKINGKEIDKNDERTLSSIGIRDNFYCYVE